MQTYLEKKGIELRKEIGTKNDYNKEDVYSANHEDATSASGKGKGTGHGGHTHVIPDFNKPDAIDYSTFNTSLGGNALDVESREFLTTISKYNKENEYGAHSVNTSANLADGQIII